MNLGDILKRPFVRGIRVLDPDRGTGTIQELAGPPFEPDMFQQDDPKNYFVVKWDGHDDRHVVRGTEVKWLGRW